MRNYAADCRSTVQSIPGGHRRHAGFVETIFARKLAAKMRIDFHLFHPVAWESGDATLPG